MPRYATLPVLPPTASWSSITCTFSDYQNLKTFCHESPQILHAKFCADEEKFAKVAKKIAFIAILRKKIPPPRPYDSASFKRPVDVKTLNVRLRNMGGIDQNTSILIIALPNGQPLPYLVHSLPVAW